MKNIAHITGLSYSAY